MGASSDALAARARLVPPGLMNGELGSRKRGTSGEPGLDRAAETLWRRRVIDRQSLARRIVVDVEIDLDRVRTVDEDRLEALGRRLVDPVVGDRRVRQRDEDVATGEDGLGIPGGQTL